MDDGAVLAAAARVFARVGVQRFTLADVGKEAGLSPATVLQRFGSKRGLLLAFAHHAADTAAAPFEEARAQSASPLAALKKALVSASADTDTRQEVIHGLGFLLEDLADDELREVAALHARRTEDAIHGLLEAAVDAGELRDGELRKLARTLHAAWNGAVIQWALRGEGELRTWIHAVFDTVLAHRRAR